MQKKFTTGFKIENNGEKPTFELTFSGIKNPQEAVSIIRTSLSIMEYQAILQERPNFGVSLLICHCVEREKLLERLKERLDKALNEYSKFFEIIIDSTSGVSVGEKRNNLLELAEKEYVCFIDDDDLVSESEDDESIPHWVQVTRLGSNRNGGNRVGGSSYKMLLLLLNAVPMMAL